MNYELEGQKIFSAIQRKLAYLFIPSKRNGYVFVFMRGDWLLYAAILLFVVKIATTAVYFPFQQNIFFADITRAALVNLLNDNRKELGLNTLTENSTLDQAAALKAQDMVKNGYFAHQSPSGVTPWFWFKQAGYNYVYAGENLAVGFVDSKAVYDAWVASPSHKANLLNPHYQEVGTAVLSGFGPNNAIVVVQEFGSRPAAPSPATPAPIAPKPQPAPAKEPAPEVTVTPTQPKAPAKNPLPQVLAQSTENFALVKANNHTVSGVKARILNTVIYNSDGYLQYIAYLMLLIVSSCMVIGMLMPINAQNRRLVLKHLAVLVILCAATFITKSGASLVLPHAILI